ncbi:MAG: diacylglycerol kinase family lipid kinase [Caldilineae bacterium]|nr:MAG: diacylglycerol kinase family lipid kinase [Caldilineae bacterium]
MKLKIILNPYSNRGGAGKQAERVQRLCQQAGLDFDLALTHRPGEAIDLARQARLDGFDVVAAAGGDGTVSEVVNGLVQATPPDQPVGSLAVFPLGSGNDFADMLGIPHRPEVCVQMIQQARTRQVDLGRAQITNADQSSMVRYFDNNMGLGFEAQVTVESRKIQRLRGFAIYLVAVLRSLRAYEQPHFQVAWTDEAGQEHQVAHRSLLVSLGNSRRTGGGFYITPDAEMDDGLLDIAIAQALTTPRILMLLPKVLRGAHRNDPAVRLVRCRTAQIRVSAPVPVHLDGEVVSEEAQGASVSLEPGRLTVLVPG